MLQIRYLRPDPRLHGLITSYYVMSTVDGASVDIDDYLLPEWPNLRCLVQGSVVVHTLDGAPPVQLVPPPPQVLVFGSTTRARRIELSGVVRLMGAGIFPRGWHQLFGVSSAGWNNRIGQITDLWDEDVNACWRELSLAVTDEDIQAAFDSLFLARLARAPQPPRAFIMEAVEQLLVDPGVNTVDDVATRVGISIRQVERLSYDIFGHSPKQVIRKFRFLRTIAAMPRSLSEGWDSAIDGYYYDQSHFIRDFKQFTGVTPSRFLKEPPVLMYGYMRSIGKAIALRTIPSAFYIFSDGTGTVPKASQANQAA